MVDLVKFNEPSSQGVDPQAAHGTEPQSETEPQPVQGLEMQEDHNEEIDRQKENMKEIDKVQSKYDTNTGDKKMKEKMQKAPGNTLDASGHIHANVKDEYESKKSAEPGVLPEHSNPHAKVRSNDPNDNFADQWKPTALPKEEQVRNDNASNPQDHLEHRQNVKHQPLNSQPTEFNRTFESTMTELRNIFDTTEYGAPINEDHKSKLSNPTPLLPIQPDELIKTLQIKAIKYIIIACCICYIVGKFNLGYIFGLCMIGLSSWAYWNLGRISSRGLEWQLEKQENMKTVSMIYIFFCNNQLKKGF